MVLVFKLQLMITLIKTIYRAFIKYKDGLQDLELYWENLCIANLSDRLVFYSIYHNLYQSASNLFLSDLYNFTNILSFFRVFHGIVEYSGIIIIFINHLT